MTCTECDRRGFQRQARKMMENGRYDDGMVICVILARDYKKSEHTCQKEEVEWLSYVEELGGMAESHQ